MKLYLVRHGESVPNQKWIIQSQDAPLSSLGSEQARFLAQRFLSLPVDLILSSPMLRAKQTAEIIQDIIQKELLFTNLLEERKRPVEMIGLRQDDPEVQRIAKLINQNISDPGWHYSTEENFFDLKARAEQFLTFLQTREEKHVLCITHGRFLRMIIWTMAFGDDLHAETWKNLQDFLKTENTGITVCEKEEGRWALSTWNDHAHLGELSAQEPMTSK